jgi:hypothetical protein
MILGHLSAGAADCQSWAFGRGTSVLPFFKGNTSIDKRHACFSDRTNKELRGGNDHARQIMPTCTFAFCFQTLHDRIKKDPLCLTRSS